MTSNFLSSPIESVASCGSDAISIVAVVAVVSVTPTWWFCELICILSLCLADISLVKEFWNCSWVSVWVFVQVGVVLEPVPLLLLCVTEYDAVVDAVFPA